MTRSPSMNFVKFTAVGLVGALALSAAPALAGNACKNVFLQFANNTSGKINIVDVDYWDPSKGSKGGWRSEPVRNETLSRGAVWRETRNLEKVNQRTTKVRFEYRVKGKLGGWSTKKYKVSTGSKTCANRTTFSAAAR